MKNKTTKNKTIKKILEKGKEEYETNSEITINRVLQEFALKKIKKVISETTRVYLIYENGRIVFEEFEKVIQMRIETHNDEVYIIEIDKDKDENKEILRLFHELEENAQCDAYQKL